MIGSGPDTFSWRTDFPPSPGHIILEADSISCPVGQNFLGKCVPPDTSAWRTDFPPTPVPLYWKYLPRNFLRLNGFISFSWILINQICYYPLVHCVTRLGFVPFLRILVPVHGLGPFLAVSSFRPHHVQAGVCVFSLVLAWDPGVCRY